VVDATDNFSARYLINDACVLLHKPFIYGAVQQFEGQVSVFNLNGGPTYRCLYPQQPGAGEIPDCNTAGVLGIAPGIIGSHQALEAVKVITGIGNILSGFLQVYDLLHGTDYKIKLKARPESRNLTQLQPSYEVGGCDQFASINASVLLNWLQDEKDCYLLDVRDREEYELLHLKQAKLLPLPQLEHRMAELPSNLPLITLCQKGSRSLAAAGLIKKHLPQAEVYSLAGGMDSWLRTLGTQMIVS
jgi:adenylyltransferase/sulfurtransferase